jgi:hypothetical protein
MKQEEAKNGTIAKDISSRTRSLNGIRKFRRHMNKETCILSASSYPKALNVRIREKAISYAKCKRRERKV